MYDEENRVTLKDIVKETGFSLVSVHRALAGKAGVGAGTRRIIIEAAERMGYQVNLMASALKRQPYTVAIVLPETEQRGSLYFNYMWRGVHDFMSEIGGYPLTFNVIPFELPALPEAEEKYQLQALDKLLAREPLPDGLITMPIVNTPEMEERIRRLTERGVKTVLIENDFPDTARLSCVSPGDEHIGRLAAELICSMVPQETGSIFVAAGNETSPSHRMNTMGFTDYVRTHRPGLTVVAVHDAERVPDAKGYYDIIARDDMLAAYSVRARNTIPLCEAALMAESRHKLLVLGSDLFKESAAMLRRGVLKGIVYKNPYEKGHRALQVLSEYLLRDKKPQEEQLVPISVIMRSNLPYFEQFI